jgi:purine nucleosidase
MRVDIETSSPLSTGQTVVDVWGQTGRPANCNVAQQVDTAAFWSLMAQAVERADCVSPLNPRDTDLV